MKRLLKISFPIIALLTYTGCQGTSAVPEASNPQTMTAGTPQPATAKPKFEFDGETIGCGDFRAYKSTKDKTKVVSLNADKKKLNLSPEPQTFEIENSKEIKVHLEDFGKSEHTDRERYCTDLTVTNDKAPVRIPAIKGKATISTAKGADEFTYNVTVILENITFQPAGGEAFTVERIEMKEVKVGWLPG